MKNSHCSLWLILAVWLMSGGGVIYAPQAMAEVTLAQNAEYSNNWVLSGSGTYSQAISLGTEQLVVDATKRVTGSAANIILTENITAGKYLQRDNFFGDTYAGAQSGQIYFQGGMTATFTGLELGGHTNLYVGSDTSTANVTVSEDTLIGSSMTSNLHINADSTFTANGKFQVNRADIQGKVYISGTMNLNSAAEDSILLGYGNNHQYTSSVDVYSGGTLNAPNSVVHCGYDGQLYFRIEAGGTANLYGLTFGRNGDQDSSYANVGKTLQLRGGTLNLGEGGVSIRTGKDSYPFQFISGTIGTIDGCDTSISNVELAIGSGNTVFQPVADATITVNSNFTNSTWASAGTGGTVQMNGAGTLDLAGSFNTTGGFEAKAGTTVVSGTFAGGKLNVNGGDVTLTGSATTSAGVEVNKGTLTIIRNQTGISSSKAEIVVNEGGSVVLTSATDATAHTLFHNPITLNGGTLSTDSSLSGRWRKLMGKLTLNADATITSNTRLEIHGGLEGTGKTLTKDGDGNLILHDVGKTGLKSIVINKGMFCIENNSSNALITEDGVYVNGGFLQFWGQSNVSANIFFNGGYFETNGTVCNSTTADSVFTLQQSTQFNMTSWTEGNPADFIMNGKLVASDGIVLKKTGGKTMTLAGNMSEFHGTIQSDTSEVILANGGNTAETAYDFNFNLNAGSARIGDTATYHFKDVENLVQFSNANNATFDLGTGSVQNHGSSSISSTIVGASITGTTGAIQLGSVGDTLNFNVADNASLTVSTAVHTQGGNFTKTGNGTLDIQNLYVDAGTFNLSDSAISAVSAGIYVAPQAKLTWDGTVDLGTTTMDMDGDFVIELVGSATDWNVDTLTLRGDNIQISLDAAFELQADFSDLSWELLFNENTNLTLLQTDLDLSGLAFEVFTDGSLFPPDVILYALGNADGSVTLHGRLPEPSSWILLLTGGLALFVTWRKRVAAGK